MNQMSEQELTKQRITNLFLVSRKAHVPAELHEESARSYDELIRTVDKLYEIPRLQEPTKSAEDAKENV